MTTREMARSAIVAAVIVTGAVLAGLAINNWDRLHAEYLWYVMPLDGETKAGLRQIGADPRKVKALLDAGIDVKALWTQYKVFKGLTKSLEELNKALEALELLEKEK